MTILSLWLEWPLKMTILVAQSKINHHAFGHNYLYGTIDYAEQCNTTVAITSINARTLGGAIFGFATG